MFNSFVLQTLKTARGVWGEPENDHTSGSRNTSPNLGPRDGRSLVIDASGDAHAVK
jgi:hypothetical protein